MKDKGSYQAFEIEDIYNRKNYIFEYDPLYEEVTMRNSSLGMHNKIMTIMPKDNATPEQSLFPFNCNDAYEYFKYMLNKALSDTRFCFLGWVDINTFKPLEE